MGSAESLSAQQIVEDCVLTGLGDSVALLNLFLNRLEGGEDAPRPQFDLLAGLLSGGRVPWTLDLDDDGSPDLDGAVYFKNADGKLTLPFDLAALLGGGLEDPASLLDDLPAGTTLHLEYGFEDLALEGDTASSGAGEVVFGFETATGNATVAGSGSFSRGPCGWDYDLADVDYSVLDPAAYPVAELAFQVHYGADTLSGTLALDGTSVGVLRVRPAGQAEEVLRVDLATGSVVS